MQLNAQPPEKKASGDGRVVDLHSMFPTIQGEGPFAGEPATFVRLAGCNLQCPGCDTIYTTGRKLMAVGGIVTYCLNNSAPNRLVVITGGEPLRQPISRLVNELLRRGFRVQLETNGTLYRDDLPYRNPNFTIVCSPKAGAVHPKLAAEVDAWKYVAHADSIDTDGLPILALDHPNSGRVYRPTPDLPKRAPIYLQPIDTGNPFDNNRHLAAVIASCLKHGYRLCLQQHKIINVE